MTLRLSRRTLLISALAFAVAAGLTATVLTAMGISFGGEGSAQPSSQYVGGLLLTSNRDRLAICVAAVGTTVGLEADAVLSVQEALRKLASNATWQKNGLDKPAPVVDPGCPSPPSVFLPNAKPVRTGKFGLLVDQAPVVQEASYYRVFVFIVDPQTLAGTFGTEYPIATQEWLRRSVDQVMPVTLGLYVTPSQVTMPDFVSGWLLFMIGGISSPPQS